MARLAIFIRLAALFSAVTVAAEDGCSAYSIDGPHNATFDFYRFYDFRSAPATDEIPTGDPAAKNREQPDVLAASRLISNSSWRDDWKVTVKYQGQPNEKALARHYVADHVFLGTCFPLSHSPVLATKLLSRVPWLTLGNRQTWRRCPAGAVYKPSEKRDSTSWRSLLQ